MKTQMIKLIAKGLISVTCTFFVGICSAENLADFHMQQGLKCEGCHQTQTPQPDSRVNTKNCFACHKSFEAVAERIKRTDPNPHNSHLGEVPCSDCHQGHKEYKNMCNDCHQFNWTTKH